jgi:hypothetical protein
VRFTRPDIQITPLLIWLLLLSTSAYAFGQLSSAPADSSAGFASAASGYSASNISYSISNTLPSTIASVKFTITPSLANVRVATVRAKLVSSSTSYSTCLNTPAGSQSWVCPISGVTVAAADQLMLDVGERPAGPGIVLRLPVIRR